MVPVDNYSFSFESDQKHSNGIAAFVCSLLLSVFIKPT